MLNIYSIYNVHPHNSTQGHKKREMIFFFSHAHQHKTNYLNMTLYIYICCDEVGKGVLPLWHSARGADGQSWSSALLTLFREGQVEEPAISQEDPLIPCFRPDKQHPSFSHTLTVSLPQGVTFSSSIYVLFNMFITSIFRKKHECGPNKQQSC